MSGWMIEALIASSMLMLLVLVIRQPVAAQFGPRVAYWLWLLPALRMVTPPIPEYWTLSPAEQVHDLALDVAPEVALAVADTSSHAPNWAVVIVATWAIGAVAHFTLHIWAYRRFAARARANVRLLREVDPGAIQVLATAEVDGPLAMGLAERTILVPADFEWRYDAQEREFAIAHELAHHRRGDLRVNLGALALLSLHWFNPLAHLAYRAFRTDQELACDATIMAAADPLERHAYGRALFKSACDRAPMIACSLNKKQELKRRLRMMKFGQLSFARGAVATALGFGLIAGGLLTTASVGAQAAAETDAVRYVQHGIDDGSAELASVIADEADHETRLIADADAKAAEAEAKMADAEARAAAEDAKQAALEASEARTEAQADAAEARREAREQVRDAEREMHDFIREAQRNLREADREGDREANRAARAALAEAKRSLHNSMRALSMQRRTWHSRANPHAMLVPPPPSAPTAPEPPAPPSAPTALEPPAAPEPPAISKACPGNVQQQQVRVVISENGQTRQFETASSSCPNRRIQLTSLHIDKTMISALKAARNRIKEHKQLTEIQRLAIMRDLDVDIRSLETRTQ